MLSDMEGVRWSLGFLSEVREQSKGCGHQLSSSWELFLHAPVKCLLQAQSTSLALFLSDQNKDASFSTILGT